ncbi:hypothetical protein [Microbulbifer variabilis]|uniref:hypothetical protein n=1 Tax=Microbulbifer variabilis TaxID=266805 RepID=UPI001CFD8D0A|nr:hypothetical protein [Microbulbifer variabilis]
MKLFSPIIFLLICCVSHAEILTTANYEVKITRNCPEGYVYCENVTYEGKSKKSGNSIIITGETWYSLCKDGITPCRFLGYRFKNGNHHYLVYSEGVLEVIKGDNTVIIRENGTWNYEEESQLTDDENNSCSYHTSKVFTATSEGKKFTVKINYDKPICSDATLIIAIYDKNGTNIYRTGITYTTLNLHDNLDTPGKRYVDYQLSSITEAIPWPEYIYSNLSEGMTCNQRWESLKDRTDIPETEKWDMLYEIEEECLRAVEFSISKMDYNRLIGTGSKLFSVVLPENFILITYDPLKSKMIEVATGSGS